MVKFLSLIFLVCIFISCSYPPPICADPEKQSGIPENCENIFPKGKWRFVHSIEASLSNGPKIVMIGVSITDSSNKSIHAALMTIEGLLLFEGEYEKGKLAVKRSVSFFDSKGFAKGLMDDILLMFFYPEYAWVKTGFTKDKKKICRYFIDRADFTDIVILKRGWEIYKYKNKRKIRKITANTGQDKTKGFVLPETIKLAASGSVKYSLFFKLIEAEKLSHP